jgi:hypothetical protein
MEEVSGHEPVQIVLQGEAENADKRVKTPADGPRRAQQAHD